MYSRPVKTGNFVIEGLNALATTIYFNYLFFHMRDQFGFTNLENLVLCAVNGFIYAFAAWFGGKFAQRHGYFFALRLGCATMGVSMLWASVASTVAAHYAAMALWTLGMSLTWPTLEAVTSEGEPPRPLQRLLGIYNLVWAGSGALAYFLGGALLEKVGRASIFLVPAALHAAQVGLVYWLEPLARRQPAAPPSPEETGEVPGHAEELERAVVPPATFLKLAWLANPFAYIAMNALIPVIPKLAERYEFGPMLAGFVCSVWLFARALAFLVLWRWTGWHYRFRWLLGAFGGLIVSFACILLSRDVWWLVAAQIVFGLAVGLIYYSSLYYSMDVGETKGEHGGFHEAAIGVGICVGPAVGAASLKFFPGFVHMNTWAVTCLLFTGLAGLVWVRQRATRALAE